MIERIRAFAAEVVAHDLPRHASATRGQAALHVALAITMVISVGAATAGFARSQDPLSAAGIAGLARGAALSAPMTPQEKAALVARESRADERRMVAFEQAQKAERARLWRIRKQEQASRLNRVVYPTGGRITATFGEHGRRWFRGVHTGIDFRVNVGTPVRAIKRGTVIYAAWHGSYGRKIMIRHPDGVVSLYAHLSRINVKVGDTVKAGQRIGRSGRSGNVTGPHLHLEIHRNGEPINPMSYLRKRG